MIYREATFDSMPEGYLEGQRESVLEEGHEDRSHGTSTTNALYLQSVLDGLGYEVGSVLDVGCGSGQFIHTLKAPRKCGMDIDGSFRAFLHDTHIRFVKGDADALPFCDGEFELVTCVAAIEHFYNTKRALCEMVRVASELVFITFPLEVPALAVPAHLTVRDSPFDWLDMVREVAEGEWRLAHLCMGGIKDARFRVLSVLLEKTEEGA